MFTALLNSMGLTTLVGIHSVTLGRLWLAGICAAVLVVQAILLLFEIGKYRTRQKQWVAMQEIADRISARRRQPWPEHLSERGYKEWQRRQRFIQQRPRFAPRGI